MIKSIDSGFSSYFCYLLAVWPWAGNLTTLCLSFLIYNMETIMESSIILNGKKLKSESRNYNEKPDMQHPGTVVQQIIQNKDWKKGRVPWLNLSLRIKAFCTRVSKLIRDRKDKFSWMIAQLVKILPAMQETPVWFLVQEDPLEKG